MEVCEWFLIRYVLQQEQVKFWRFFFVAFWSKFGPDLVQI